MNKKFIGIITIIIIFIGVGVYVALNRERSLPSQRITNFEECVRAGHLVAESYPRQCWTPDGRYFVEGVEQNSLPPSGSITISGEMTCLPKTGNG